MTHGAGSHTRPEDTSVDVVTDPDGLPELPLLYGGRRGDHVHLDQGANMEGLIATGYYLGKSNHYFVVLSEVRPAPDHSSSAPGNQTPQLTRRSCKWCSRIAPGETIDK